MTLTRGLHRAAVGALVLAAALAVWSWGNQRHTQAEESTLAEQILCYINSEYGPPIPRFHVGDCPPPQPPPPPPPPPSAEDTLQACSDGADNDNDTFIDLLDSGCASFAPKLVVVKTVINDNGGTALAQSFSLHISNGIATTTVASGATTTVASGAWVVGEISNPAYAGTFGGDCNLSGEVTLLAGDTKTCVITNDDIAPPPVGDGNPPTNPSPADGSSQAGSGSSGGGGGGGGGGGSGSTGLVLGAATTSAPLSPPIPQALCDRYLTAFIRFNFKNDTEQVKRLQMVLRDVEGAPVNVNGAYDAATLAAVHAFQMKYASDILAPWGARAPTGFVYLTTRKKINELYCRNARRFDLTAQELATIEHTRAGASSTPRAPAAIVAPAFFAPRPGVQAPPPQTAAVQEAVQGAAGGKNIWEHFLDFFRHK